MAIEFKPNFFTGGSAPATATPPTQIQVMQIAFVNDPKFRAAFGGWLYDHFDILAREYKANGRFLSLKEIDEPLTEF